MNNSFVWYFAFYSYFCFLLWLVLLLTLRMQEQFALYQMLSVKLAENPKFPFDGFLTLFCQFYLDFIGEGSQKLAEFAKTTSVNATDFDSLDMQMNYISELISIYNG